MIFLKLYICRKTVLILLRTNLLDDLVLDTLLKTNRPPTDEEKAIIHKSMAPTKGKLKVVQTQIADTVDHIQALKARVERNESKLKRLREEEAAILETSKNHRRVPFLPFEFFRRMSSVRFALTA